MSSDMVKLLELLLIVGVIFWFGFSQLRALKKDPPKARKRDERDRE